MHVLSKAALGFLGLLGSSYPANAAVVVNFGSTNAISANNDFQSELNGLGLTQLATTGASLMLDADSMITFDLLGSESGFDDTFNAPSISYTEMTLLLNSFASPIGLGSGVFTAGDLAGLLTFTSSGGATATVGDRGFGIFLGPNALSGDASSVFYFGYDDQITNQDDDFDDFIVRATVTPLAAVPEPGTWAMMLIGFAGVGFALRRKQRPAGTQLA
jgi:hypothetical protein